MSSIQHCGQNTFLGSKLTSAKRCVEIALLSDLFHWIVLYISDLNLLLLQVYEEYLSVTNTTFPHYTQEMLGIAQGAGLPFEEV